MLGTAVIDIRIGLVAFMWEFNNRLVIVIGTSMVNRWSMSAENNVI